MFGFLKKKKEAERKLTAFVSGNVLTMEEAKDAVFSSKALGEGVVIEPSEDVICSPVNGTVAMIMPDSCHAIAITDDNGMEILVHVGLDTVSMNGEGFEPLVKQGDKVKAGQKILGFSREKIKAHGLCDQVIMVITNTPDFPDVVFHTGVRAEAGETVIAVY